MANKFFAAIRARFFNTAADTALDVGVSGDANPRLSIDAGGKISWGDGTNAVDTNIYRDAADVLKTDDTLKVPVLFIDGIEVDTTGATTDQVLKYNGTKFLPATGSSVGALNDLSDVVITTPLEFQTLEYNGTEWVNANTPSSVYVRNAEATTITTGTCVYLFGATGDHATVKRADHNSDATSAKTVGVVSANILTSENGVVVTQGYVDGIDLSTGYTAGDVLWLGEAGAFTTTKPTAPDHLVFIGVVVRATNNGIIYVATQNGYELDELHNVSLSSPASGDFLKYNGSLWVADAIDLGTDTTGNYMSGISGTSPVSVAHTPAEGSSATVALASGYGDTQNPYASKTANYVLAAPNGSAGVPTFRAIVAADIPTLNQNTTGTAATVTGAAQTAITSVGTLSGLRVDGNTAIGTAPLAGYSFFVSKPITGLTTSYGIVSSGTVQSDVTSSVNQFISGGNTAATAFTLGSYNHFAANGVATPGSGSTITTQNGFLVNSSTTGALNNFAFRGLIPTGANNNWNLYMDGTAPNYMAGRLGIGTATGAAMLRVQNDTAGNATVVLRNAAAQSGPSLQIVDSANAQIFAVGTTGNVGIGTVLSAGAILRINKPITGSTVPVGYYITSAVDGDFAGLTSGIGYFSTITASGSTAVPDLTHILVFGGTSTTKPTVQNGFVVNSAMTDGVSNRGFVGQLNAATDRWNLYMSGSAQNYLAGNLGIGTATPSTALQVVGTVTATAFAGPLTGNVTGNVSGTAATVTGAAQTAITSVGTLGSLAVTGDLTVDTTTLKVDSTNNRVGIGTASPSSFLHVASGALGGTAGDELIATQVRATNTNQDIIYTKYRRVSTGADWTSAQAKIQRTIDATDMGYVAFGGTAAFDVRIGSGTTDIATFASNGTIVTTSTAAAKVLVVKGAASQSGDFLDIQDSAGASQFKVGFNAIISTKESIEVGALGTGNRYAGIDFIGDTTYTDYGLRLLRGDGGANTFSRLIHRGTGQLEITTQEASPLTFSTTNTERMRIDASGNLLLGTTSRRSVGGSFQTAVVNQIFNEQGSGGLTAFTSVLNRADSNGLRFVLGKSRGTAAGAVTALVDGDSIAELMFAGADGTTLDPLAARIIAQVDGTVATGSVPGRITFFTTSVGASVTAERMRITNAGNVGISTTAPVAKLEVLGSDTVSSQANVSGAFGTTTSGRLLLGSITGNTPFIGSEGATTLAFTTNATVRMRIDSSGNVGIGTSSPTEKLDVAGNIALTGSVVFEGATADAFETTLSVTDPTADRTITLPNASGTVALIAVSDTAPTSPVAGNLWFKSDTGNLLVYYDSYWIDAGAPNYATLDGGSA